MAKNVYNALRSVAEGQANRVFKSAVGVLRNKAIDIIRGEKSSGDTSDFASIFSKYSTQNLTFPLDIEAPAGANGNQGHYIQFFVNEQTDEVLDYMNKDKYDAGLTPEDTPESILYIAQQMAELEILDNLVGPKRNNAISDPYGVDATRQLYASEKMNRKHTSLSVKRRPTVRMTASICMYMPPTVEVKYGADYTDTEIGTGTMLGAAAYQDILAGKGLADTAVDTLNQSRGGLEDGAIRAAFGAIDLLPGFAGSREVFEMQRGFIKAPRMELAFKGIPKREFSYEFKMMPKSAAEAAMAEKIVKKFKTMMLPEIKDASAMRLTMPATFDIQYMHVGQENSHLNKIGTCVLTNMDVKYGGDKYKTYKDAVPMETSMTLNFKELDLITREKAEEGF